MNTKRIMTSAVKSILILMSLVGGLGFTQASGNTPAEVNVPDLTWLKTSIQEAMVQSNIVLPT